ncbi:hypothetical protein DFH07DRAFT_1062377 [Mycena maculata]|uniref:Uncharacterized protein n=1 Tax=Mycena maculata TaxID=230809 RepID=A0AAD7IUB9_9AGAR|nr:hypothetical protein DFH07DRAFT_1062377 [Mycena maculata]
MPSVSCALFVSALFLSVNAFCGDNGGVELGWGTQAAADANGENPSTVLGFSSSGPFDAAGNPILSVIATNAGFGSSYYAFEAFICGQYNPDSYPQTSFGAVITTASSEACLTVSALESANATISLQPCVNDISSNPVPTQMFQWVGTNYITYGFAFIGNQSVPVKYVATDYVPTLVDATDTTAAYIRLDYAPGGLPPSTGLETGLILELSDD